MGKDVETFLDVEALRQGFKIQELWVPSRKKELWFKRGSGSKI